MTKSDLMKRLADANPHLYHARHRAHRVDGVRADQLGPVARRSGRAAGLRRVLGPRARRPGRPQSAHRRRGAGRRQGRALSSRPARNSASASERRRVESRRLQKVLAHCAHSAGSWSGVGLAAGRLLPSTTGELVGLQPMAAARYEADQVPLYLVVLLALAARASSLAALAAGCGRRDRASAPPGTRSTSWSARLARKRRPRKRAQVEEARRETQARPQRPRRAGVMRVLGYAETVAALELPPLVEDSAGLTQDRRDPRPRRPGACRRGSPRSALKPASLSICGRPDRRAIRRGRKTDHQHVPGRPASPVRGGGNTADAARLRAHVAGPHRPFRTQRARPLRL